MWTQHTQEDYWRSLLCYLLCTEPWLEALGGLIRLLGGTVSMFWPFSPGLWLEAWVSAWVSLCALSCVKGFCLFRTPSLPALISFSPTLSTRARSPVPGHSFLGEGSLDPAPNEGGRASLEALDILQVSGSAKLLSLSQPVWLQLCPVGNPGFQLSVSVTLWLSGSSVLRLVQVGWEGQREGGVGKPGGGWGEGWGVWVCVCGGGLIAPWKVFSSPGVASWDHPPKQTVWVCVRVCVDKPVEWQDLLCQMQTETQVSNVSAFRLFNPVSLSPSFTLSPPPSLSLFADLSCSLPSSLIICQLPLPHAQWFFPMLLSSSASSPLFSFAPVNSLLFADAQREIIPVLRQRQTRARERFRDS